MSENITFINPLILDYSDLPVAWVLMALSVVMLVAAFFRKSYLVVAASIVVDLGVVFSWESVWVQIGYILLILSQVVWIYRQSRGFQRG